LLVFTDRDNDAGGPVPVAVSVTLCDFPSQGTATLPAPVTGKPAPAGSGWPSTEKFTACALLVDQPAATSTVLPVHVTSSSRSNAVMDGALLGGGALDVFTCRAMAAWPPAPVACSTTECSRPSQGTWMLPMPLAG